MTFNRLSRQRYKNVNRRFLRNLGVGFAKGIIPIICDDCKFRHTVYGANKDEANKRLYIEGWTMNPNARKYIHLCKFCRKKRRGW